MASDAPGQATLADTVAKALQQIQVLQQQVAAQAVVETPASVFVPLAIPLTSTAWDGNAKTAADTGVLDLSAIFGVPAGVKAVAVSLTMNSGTIGYSISLSTNTAAAARGNLTVRTHRENAYNDGSGIIVCDANGDIYVAISGNLDYVFMRVLGYWPKG
jgi:hypothetical protein